jgi:hypothetical protein
MCAKATTPSGVNLLLSHDLRPPVSAAATPEATVQAVQAALNPMRTALALPTTLASRTPPPDLVPEVMHIARRTMRVVQLHIGILANSAPLLW